MTGQEPEATQYLEPFNTIAAIALAVIMMIYIVGAPSTVAVSAVLWRQRTRPAPRPPAPPPAAPGPSPPPVPAPRSAGSALLQLQRVEQEVLALPEQPVSTEVSARLAAEVAGLRARHSPASPVGRYAAGLQLLVAALTPPTVATEPGDPPPPVLGGGAPPDPLRVGLGQFAALGRPIPVRWAFAWYGHLVDRWPAEAERDQAGFAAAFARHYQATYPYGGMIIALTGRRLGLPYTPASARFGGRPIEVATPLPEVATLPEPVRRLHAVAAAAARELRPPVSP